MKIAILARGLARPGGVSRLTKGYVRALPEAAPGDEFFILTDSPLDTAPRPNVTEVNLGKAHPALFDHYLVPRAAKRIGPDVLVATKNTVPRGLPCPCVCMFLDLAYFAMPEAYPALNNLYARAMMRRSAKAAARIVAISRSTREDIGRYLSKDAFEKTRVVYPGIDGAFRPFSDEERRSAAERFSGLPEWFALYAGNISPRKNIERLLEAFDGLDRDVALVMTGHRSWKSDHLEPLFAKARLKRRVMVLGPQSDEGVIALYNLATASVYPSLYEGFGFPVLESFACGTPVVASNATSIPEVAGDAAMLVDPRDPKAIAEALKAVLANDTLRAELRAKGLARAAEFTWERSVGEMLAVIREAA